MGLFEYIDEPSFCLNWIKCIQTSTIIFSNEIGCRSHTCLGSIKNPELCDLTIIYFLKGMQIGILNSMRAHQYTWIIPLNKSVSWKCIRLQQTKMSEMSCIDWITGFLMMHETYYRAAYIARVCTRELGTNRRIILGIMYNKYKTGNLDRKWMIKRRANRTILFEFRNYASLFIWRSLQ